MSTLGRKFACLLLAGAVFGGTVADASAATARHYSRNGRHYAGHHYRHYGNPAVGAAVAGTALGIIGLAAGAAARNRYDDDYGPGYYGYGPGYDGGGYGYGGPYGYGGGWAPY